MITVCDRARQSCPVFPGQMNSLHWGLDDPSEVEGTDQEKLEAFRRTRMEVATRLRPFIEIALRAAGRPPAASARVRAHVAEFVGTFVLVFAGCGAIAVGRLDTAGIAVAFGLAIAVMVYAFGHVSGAHFNPAVSIGFALGRHFPWPRVVTYGIAQVAGAIAGRGDLPMGARRRARSASRRRPCRCRRRSRSRRCSPGS